MLEVLLAPHCLSVRQQTECRNAVSNQRYALRELYSVEVLLVITELYNVEALLVVT